MTIGTGDAKGNDDIGRRANDALAVIRRFAREPDGNRVAWFVVAPRLRSPALPRTDQMLTSSRRLTDCWTATATADLVAMGFLAQAPGRPDGELTGTRRCVAFLETGRGSGGAPTPAWAWDGGRRPRRDPLTRDEATERGAGEADVPTPGEWDMVFETAVKVARRDVAEIVAATFPGYRGRRISVEARESATMTDVNWSGGTRSSYAACTLDGRRVGDASRFAAMHPAENPAEGATVPIPVGAALVEHRMFCGKDLGLRIHVNPADMPRVLPAAPAA